MGNCLSSTETYNVKTSESLTTTATPTTEQEEEQQQFSTTTTAASSIPKLISSLPYSFESHPFFSANMSYFVTLKLRHQKDYNNDGNDIDDDDDDDDGTISDRYDDPYFYGLNRNFQLYICDVKSGKKLFRISRRQIEHQLTQSSHLKIFHTISVKFSQINEHVLFVSGNSSESTVDGFKFTMLKIDFSNILKMKINNNTTLGIETYDDHDYYSTRKEEQVEAEEESAAKSTSRKKEPAVKLVFPLFIPERITCFEIPEVKPPNLVDGRRNSFSLFVDCNNSSSNGCDQKEEEESAIILCDNTIFNYNFTLQKMLRKRQVVAVSTDSTWSHRMSHVCDVNDDYIALKHFGDSSLETFFLPTTQISSSSSSSFSSATQMLETEKVTVKNSKTISTVDAVKLFKTPSVGSNNENTKKMISLAAISNWQAGGCFAACLPCSSSNEDLDRITIWNPETCEKLFSINISNCVPQQYLQKTDYSYVNFSFSNNIVSGKSVMAVSRTQYDLSDGAEKESFLFFIELGNIILSHFYSETSSSSTNNKKGEEKEKQNIILPKLLSKIHLKDKCVSAVQFSQNQTRLSCYFDSYIEDRADEDRHSRLVHLYKFSSFELHRSVFLIKELSSVSTSSSSSSACSHLKEALEMYRILHSVCRFID